MTVVRHGDTCGLSGTSQASVSGRKAEGAAETQPEPTWMMRPMPLFIELTLTSGKTFHVDTEGVNAEPAIKRFAQKAKSGDWIETVEGAWVNPDQIATATIIDLPSAPTGQES